MSIPNPPAAPRILPPSSNSLSISVPSTSPKYPWFDQAASHEHDFAPNASLTPSRRPSMLSTTPVRDLSPIGLGDDSGSSSSSGATSVEEKRKRKALSVDEVQQSPRTGAIRNRPLRSHRQVRVFHHDQPYPQHQQLSPTHKPHKLPLELPPPTSPTRRRAFRRRHWFYRQLARARRSRFLAHPTTYLALYFTLNLSLTLYNKSLLINFPFPYTLSALHALCGSIGTFILVRTGSSPVPRLNAHETLILLAFSGLYTVNIIVSNVSLGLVTVPFHQVVRASTPLFTILFSALILGTRSSRTKLLALLPVVAGVGFACDLWRLLFYPWGFFLTLLGTVLASLKTIFTNFLQTPSPPPPPHMQKRDPAAASPSVSRTTRLLPPLTPLHLLHLLSPLAFVQTTLLAHFSGELDRVQAYATAAAGARYSPISGFARGLGQQQPPSGLSNTQLALLVINGVMAFALNVVSFSANRKVGALSMTVAANVKQVLTVLCAVVLFSLTITPMNAVGIVLTLVGGAVYAAVELKERREKVAD